MLDEAAVAAAIAPAVGIADEVEQLDSPKVRDLLDRPRRRGPVGRPQRRRDRRSCSRAAGHRRDSAGRLLLTVSDGSFMEKVVELLVDASKRRRGSRSYCTRTKRPRTGPTAQRLGHIRPQARGVHLGPSARCTQYTKLHAKCLVVDRLQMLVTSANFTFHGLESNIELGLLVRNQPLASDGPRPVRSSDQRQSASAVGGRDMTDLPVGSLVKARGREWVVLPDSDDEMLVLQPVTGSERETAGVLTDLEAVEPATFPLPDFSTLRRGRRLAAAP